MMKRLTLMGLLLLLLAGCSAPTLDDYVNEFKNRMPEDMGNGLVMTDIGVVDDYLLFISFLIDDLMRQS